MGIKRIAFILLGFLGMGLLLFLVFGKTDRSRSQPNLPVKDQISNSKMKLTSPAFQNRNQIPTQYTCDGQNINPPLLINEVPEDTQSLALIIDDPDAPAGDWVHWLIWNINPKLKMIAEGQVPKGSVQGLNDFGQNNYGGPCPPSGEHHYQFKLYALDTVLNLSPLSSKGDLLEAIKGHLLDQALLVGRYKRQK